MNSDGREAREERRQCRTGKPPEPLSPLSSLLSPLKVIAVFSALTLSGCGGLSSRPSAPLPPTTDTPSPPPVTAPRAGGYYLDDGPGANPPADIDRIPDAVPRWEPLRPANMRPYVAMGVSYQPMTTMEPYKAQGLATWYGRRYHGKPTASGEPYDMYAMTAAHAVLPIPSYARVTNLKSGSTVVVRINDRGPFVEGRLIDVSYTAAHKLGILAGATMVEVESIMPTKSSVVAVQAPPQPVRQQPANVVAAPPPAADKPPAAKPPPPETRAAPATVTPAPEAATMAAAGAATTPDARTVAAPAAVTAPEERVAAAPPALAAPAPAVAATPPQAPIATENGRVFLQLGAFASRENAEAFLSRLKSQVDWLSLQIVTRDGLHRVQAGPYANQYDARQSAQRVAQALGIKPMVQTR